MADDLDTGDLIARMRAAGSPPPDPPPAAAPTGEFAGTIARMRLAGGAALAAPPGEQARRLGQLHAAAGSTHEGLDADAQALGIDPARTHQEFGLEQARAKLRGEPESATNYAARKALPFGSWVRGLFQQDRVNEARKALAENRADPAQLEQIARQEWEQGKDRQYQHEEGFGVAALDKLAGLAPIAGESLIGPGRLLKPVVTKPVDWLLRRQVRAGGEAAAATFLGRTAAQGLTLPYTVPTLSPAQGALRNAGEKGGNWYDWKNYGPAMGEAHAKAAVIGAVQSNFASLPVLARAPLSGLFGTVEAAAADLAVNQLGYSGSKGEFLDHALRKDADGALRAAALDAIAFTAFAALHPRQPRKPGEKPDPKVVAADAEAYKADGHTVAPDGSVKPPETRSTPDSAPPPGSVRAEIDAALGPEPETNRQPPAAESPEKPAVAAPEPATEIGNQPAAPEQPPAPDPLKLLTPAEISQFARANGINPQGKPATVLKKIAASPSAWAKLLDVAGKRAGSAPETSQAAPGSTIPPPAGVRPPTGENAPTGRQGPALTRRERLGQLLAAAAAAKPHDPLAGRLHDVIKNAGLAGRVNEGLSSDVRAAVDYPSDQPGKSLRLTVEHLPDRNALEVNFEYATRLGGLIDRTVGMPHAAGLTLIRDLGKIAGQAKAAGLDVTFKAEPGRAALYDRGLRKAGYEKAGEADAGAVNGKALKEYVYKPARPAGEVSGRPATLLEKLRARQAAKAEVAKTAAPVTAARGRTEFGPPAEAAAADPAAAYRAAGLSAREIAVLEGRKAGRSLTDLGDELELSKERVRQIEAGAREKLGAGVSVAKEQEAAGPDELVARRDRQDRQEGEETTTAEGLAARVRGDVRRGRRPAEEAVAGAAEGYHPLRASVLRPEHAAEAHEKAGAADAELAAIHKELRTEIKNARREGRPVDPAAAARLRARADELHARRRAEAGPGDHPEAAPAADVQGRPGEAVPAPETAPGRAGTPLAEWRQRQAEARLAKEQAALAAAAERKAAVDAKAARSKPQDKSEYALATVQHLGGIDPKSESFLAHYGSYREAIADGVPLRSFRSAAKGGRGLDQIAQEMAARGELPSGEPQHVLDLLRNRAPTAAADTTAAVGARAAARDAADRLEQAKAEHAERMGMDEGFGPAAPKVADALTAAEKADRAAADALYGKPSDDLPAGMGAASVRGGAAVADAPAARSWRDVLRGWWDNWRELGGATAPRTARLSTEAADNLARHASAPEHVARLSPMLQEAVLGPVREAAVKEAAESGIRFQEERFERRVMKLMATGYEERLRHTKAQYTEAAHELARRFKAATDPIERAALRKQAVDAADAADGVKTMIGRENAGLDTEAAYRESVGSAEYKQYKARWQEHVAPVMDRLYRLAEGMGAEQEIESLTQLPDFKFNAKAVRSEDDPAAARGTVAWERRGALTNPKLHRLGFARRFGGAADGYDIDPRAVIEHSLAKSASLATKADLYRTFERTGVGRWAEPGAEAPQTADGRAWRKLPDVNPPKGTQAAGAGEKHFLVHPDAYNETVKALDLADPYKAVPGAQAVTSASLFALVEAASHVKNNITMQFRPGMNPFGTIANVARWLRADPWMMKKVAELAEIGAIKPRGMESAPLHEPVKVTKNPLTWAMKGREYLGRALDTWDTATRVAADRAFERLVARGAENSEVNRRDFINQLGNYQRRTQNDLVRLLKDTRIGPFAVAAANYTVEGMRALTFNPGVKANTYRAAAAFRAEMAGRILAFGALAPVLNYLFNGRVDGDEKTPFGAVKVRTKGGKTGYVDLLGFTGFTRGARATGLLALIEGTRAKASGDDIGKRGTKDAAHAVQHVGQGPAVSLASGLFLGENSIGMPVGSKPAPGFPNYNSEMLARVQGALVNVSPPAANLTGQDRPRDTDSSTEERLFRLLGPFGVQYRQSPPGHPLRHGK